VNAALAKDKLIVDVPALKVKFDPDIVKLALGAIVDDPKLSVLTNAPAILKFPQVIL
jgi:hypothetical protein